MKKYRKTALLEVIGRTWDGDYVVRNVDNHEDVWEIPKNVFESTYEEVTE